MDTGCGWCDGTGNANEIHDRAREPALGYEPCPHCQVDEEPEEPPVEVCQRCGHYFYYVSGPQLCPSCSKR